MNNVFLSWLVSKWRTAALVLCLVASYGIIMWLGNMINEITIYALLMSAVIAVLFGVLDFSRYNRRHKELKGLLEKIVVSLDDLPTSNDIIVQDYNSLLKKLNDDRNDRMLKADMSYRDLVDYYTLWAHQIKTPISAMRLLLQTNKAEGNAELELELMRIEQYVDMVLTYLRVDSDSTDYVIRENNIDDIIKQVLRKNAKLFIRKKLTLEYEDLNFAVNTDEKWLCFVIEQIITNSVKYTKQGGTIKLYAQDEKSLVIEDNGIGIASEDLPRVFEKSFTGYNGRDDKKATGLGLYLCKKILHRLGHTINIDSKKGKGTKVVIGLGMYDLDTRD